MAYYIGGIRLENHEKSQSREPLPHPRFEAGTFRLQGRSCTATPNCSVQSVIRKKWTEKEDEK